MIARAGAEYDNGRIRDGCGRVECLLRCDASGAPVHRCEVMTRGSAPGRIAGALPLRNVA
ncbi:hypothetical protein GW15_0215840 [Xanthomonas axonopodis pv. vasculorum]|uniref:Uncharacterized protein n=1 Tax=Xanthomonas axonopodis pv. vasculorum TaxID=325777 RepID=A0A098PWS3_9XANT|nr:hypothetical protein GW15_0215840 [Xanthomonas axonopodis pv. vasculorum]PPV10099.1 hypothetical protein XavaCFBP5823_10470 [Xanthomonas axonopodis pv. vasculorum]